MLTVSRSGNQDGFVVIGPDSNVAKRKVSKSYYCLDYKQFIDVVKFKMHKINQMIETTVTEGALKYSYICPICQRKFGGLDVSRLKITEEGFLCDLCESLIREEDRSEQGISKLLLTSILHQPLLSNM